MRGKYTFTVIDLTAVCTGDISCTVFGVPMYTFGFIPFKIGTIAKFFVIHNAIAAIGSECTFAVINLTTACTGDVSCTVFAVPLYTLRFIAFKNRTIAQFAITENVIAAVCSHDTLTVIDLTGFCTSNIPCAVHAVPIRTFGLVI